MTDNDILASEQEQQTKDAVIAPEIINRSVRVLTMKSLYSLPSTLNSVRRLKGSNKGT